MKTRVVILPAAALCAAMSVAGPSRAQPANSPPPNHTLVDKIVVTSDRHVQPPPLPPLGNNFEIYLLNLDGSGEQRLTYNNVGDGFGTLSPDGKKIVFARDLGLPGQLANTNSLFVMNADGTDQTFLARGSSPTWSPDSKNIAFHASASGTGLPINGLPGAATDDSDIFIANVDDLLEHGTPPRNLTNSPNAVDDDPDWSPDGHYILYTSHDANQHPVPPAPLNYTTAEIYVRHADGTGTPTRLTTNTEEERATVWSHAGDRIAYMCRDGSPNFKICLMNPDGTGQTPHSAVQALSASWSPDDSKIYFNRPTLEPGATRVRNEIWWVCVDATKCLMGEERRLVDPEIPAGSTGSTLFADVGVLRVKTNN